MSGRRAVSQRLLDNARRDFPRRPANSEPLRPAAGAPCCFQTGRPVLSCCGRGYAILPRSDPIVSLSPHGKLWIAAPARSFLLVNLQAISCRSLFVRSVVPKDGGPDRADDACAWEVGRGGGTHIPHPTLTTGSCVPPPPPRSSIDPVCVSVARGDGHWATRP